MTDITIYSSKKTRAVSPLLYGIFFEDINYAGDGGLYAELIANRSFEYYDRDEDKDLRTLCWEQIGNCSFSIHTRFPLSKAHGNYARLSGDTGCGLRNLGFCREGFAISEGRKFRFSCYARNAKPMSLKIRLVDKNEAVYCEKKLALVRAEHEWTKYTLTLTPSGTCKYVYPEILLDKEGSVDLDMISLFPLTECPSSREGSSAVSCLRADLVEMLRALSPRFMRFPGGCIVEGRSFENMYNWKETVGPITERRTNWNRWQMAEYQLKDKNSEDYFQSYGLGFYEYFCLCEEIGAAPLPVVNAGMTCQWHEGLLVDMDKLDPWIQDVLDLIEFANGAPESKWGKIRAQMGHPTPFGLEYVGIGNEQWGEVYFRRFEAFQKVLSKQHPEIKLVTSAGWTAEGADFDFAYAWMKENKEKAYAVDEHFYKSPEWFLANIHRYDDYDRSLPKVFAGEYAAHSHPDTNLRKNNWYSALCEAAFLTGVEKNADHVVMACYAPLFARTGRQQWQPDLIWFDNDSVYGTPSYYVQKLFSNHVGTSLVQMEVNDSAKEAGGPEHLQAVATLSEDGSCLYIKLVNLSDEAEVLTLHTDKPAVSCTLHRLCSAPDATNSHEEPENVSPTVLTYAVSGCQLPELTLPGYSVTVLDVLLELPAM